MVIQNAGANASLAMGRAGDALVKGCATAVALLVWSALISCCSSVAAAPLLIEQSASCAPMW